MADKPFSIKFQGYSDSATHMSETMPGDQQPKWRAAIFSNMRLRENKCIQRRGQQPVGLGPYPDVQMLEWMKIGSTEYRLVVTSGSVVDDITGAISGGAHRFTPGIPANCAWINGVVIIGNGLDPNVRFDGSTVTRLTVQPASATGMVLTAGAAGSPNGSYGYVLKFLSAGGVEGDIAGLGTTTPGVSPVITVANKQIILTSIPVCPAGEDCTQKNLYRTKDGGVVNGVGSAYFLVATLSNSTTAYTDNTSDANLGLEMLNLSSPNSPFPPCRYFQEHVGRLCGGYCLTAEGDTRTLYISDSLDPTTARVANSDPTDPVNAYQGGRFQLASRAAGDITALSESFGSTLIVFTGGEMHLWTGTELGNFQLYPFAQHGCVSHRTIGHFENLLLWLAPDGVYSYMGSQYASYTGQAFKRISEDVRNTIDGMSASGMANASAVVSDNRYYLFWPDGCLVVDLLYGGSWSSDGPNRFGQATNSLFTPDNRSRIYAMSLNGSASGVWQLEVPGVYTDNGQPIDCHLRSADYMLGGPQQNARVIRYGATLRGCAETVSGSLIRGSAQTIQTVAVHLTSGSAMGLGNNGAVFDYSANPLVITRMRQKTSERAVSDWFALEFRALTTSGEFEVLDGCLEYETGGGVNG